jgi:hypothetical protein
LVILITPPQAQLQTAVSGNAGKLFIWTFDAPGFQGLSITGIQGIGVKTPNAAAVAVATAGLAMEVHIPKDGMLIMGAKSIIVAANFPVTMTGEPLGMTIKELGAAPKGTHCKDAPIQTC